MTGVSDYAHIDTTPGAEGERAVFAPPAGFEGGPQDYLVWLRSKYRELTHMTWFHTGPNRCSELVVYGPYADVFHAAFRKVCEKTKGVATG